MYFAGQAKLSAYDIAVRELTRKWSHDIGVDKAASLISRVALNAVYLEPESSSVIHNACPDVWQYQLTYSNLIVENKCGMEI